MGLDDRLSTFAKEVDLKFSPARGSISDADSLSPLVECVNLSCGYYEPHSSREYTNLNELWDTFQLCEQMLVAFDYTSVSAKRMQDFKSARCPYNSSVTSYSYSSSWKKDEETEDDKEPVKKKTSSKTKMITTTGTTTTRGTTVTGTKAGGKFGNKEYMQELMDECKEQGVAYDIDTDMWIVPLLENPEEAGATPTDIIESMKCPCCGTSVTLLQQSVDALYVDYYDKSRDTCIGLCEHCLKPVPVKRDIDYLM
jgi:hypothetical protein